MSFITQKYFEMNAVATALPAARSDAAPFWQRRYVWLLLALASVLPFCFVTVLPMVDLENHIGRYYVFLNIDHSAFLRRFYSLHWSLIGNLGVDLLVRAIGPLLGVEWATRIVVGSIPALTVAGIYAVSKSVSGSVMPGALLAVSSVYNWPFISGFVNYSLAAAVALLVFALWVRLRDLSFASRCVLFAPLAFLTFIAHTAGWGLLGLMVLAYELSRLRSGDVTALRVVQACLQPLPFAVVVLFIITWRTGTSSGAGIMMDSNLLTSKLLSIGSIWRERYVYWDVFFGFAYMGLAVCLFICGGRRFIAANLVIFGAISIVFLVCPFDVFGSDFADRRLLPYAAMFMPLTIGIAPRIVIGKSDGHALNLVARFAVALFCARILVSCYAWHQASNVAEEKLAILKNVPINSRIFGLVVDDCSKQWARIGRLDHLQQYALIRRDSMINGGFQNSGLNEVESLLRRSGSVDPKMGAVVRDERCPAPLTMSLQFAMAQFPVELFDYVWIIREGPTGAFDTHRLREIAAVGDDRLYKVLP